MKFHTLKLATFAVLIAALTAYAQPREEEQDNTGPADKDLKHITIKGRVESVEGQHAVLRTENGELVTVHLGPARFWREHGYHLDEGVRIRVEGWGDLDDEEGAYIFAGGIYGRDFSFEISDSRGFPLWADGNDYDTGWSPQESAFEVYYFGNPWAWGPPPRWWAGPRWRWHWYGYHHYAPPRRWDHRGGPGHGGPRGGPGHGGPRGGSGHWDPRGGPGVGGQPSGPGSGGQPGGSGHGNQGRGGGRGHH